MPLCYNGPIYSSRYQNRIPHNAASQKISFLLLAISLNIEFYLLEISLTTITIKVGGKTPKR
jgi:hypothetical protein